MATPQMQGYEFENQVPLSTMMEQISNKRLKEEQLASAQQDRRANQMQMFQDTVATTSKMVEKMVAISTARQQRNAREVLANIMLEPGQQELMSTPQGPVPFSETEAGRTQDKRRLAAVMQAFPDAAGKEMAEQAFAAPKKLNLEQMAAEQALRESDGDSLKAWNKLKAEGRMPVVRLNAQGTGYEILDEATNSFNTISSPSTAGRRQIDNLPRYLVPQFDKEVNRYHSDPLQDNTRRSLEQITNLETLLDTDVGAATEAIKSIVARVIAGEKGVLTDPDVARASGNQALIPRIKQLAQKWYDGKWTEQNKKEFESIINAVRKNSERNFENTTKRYTDRISKRFNLNSNEVAEYLRLNTPEGTPNQTQDDPLLQEALNALRGGLPKKGGSK